MQNMQVTSFLYVAYSEVFGYRAKFKKIEDKLSKFNLTHVVSLLSRISILLSLERLNKNERSMKELQDLLEENFIDEDVKWWITQSKRIKSLPSNERPIFHRQQIQTLIRLALLSCSDDSTVLPTGRTDAGYQLGRCCLMLNDYIFSETELKAVTRGEHETKMKFVDLQITQNLEFNNPLEAGSGILRAWSMFVDLLPSDEMAQIIKTKLEGFDLSDEFKRITNGLTLEKYLEMALMTYTWFATQNRKELLENQSRFLINTDTYFTEFNVLREDFNRYLFLDSIELSDLIRRLPEGSNLLPHFDFATFRRWPYIRFSNNQFTCVDLIFLVEKLNEGIFWSIINSSDDKEYRKKAFKSFGHLFELYINRLLALSSKDKFFIPSPQWGDGNSSFDGIICDGGHITVLEYKSSFLLLNAKYSGSLNAFEADLDEKFGRKKKGVVQLVKNIERLFHVDPAQRHKRANTIPHLSEYLKNNKLTVEQITPVLVVQEPFLRFDTSQKFLLDYWSELIQERKILDGIKLNPLVIKHANEVLEQTDVDYRNTHLGEIFDGLKDKYKKI